ncbi:hypothetical protein GCM10012320_28870 [Sinomonas cellulolyticus]|uniref:LysM peptidoglycan-binding domain-containing protein n=1 Tax=Sinomonas cellulolyticus TaxID=2801916 RepID=A0ABS1K524_9MICC|nr:MULTISPECIES: LysM peptidoglycan-binding domain-containing protein [Sinomonas]MBL0706745.1 LysM peptidoglycan-binding domain-containing protein [Sinomonas cellulolyticus]GHG56415.1 hypothetical protein GCM10012320_28870 [Sinomonas sp. KCTC 49339]
MAQASVVGQHSRRHPAPHRSDAATAASSRKAPPLRLTRRGRVVLIVIPAFLAALALLVAWAALMAPAHASAEHLEGPGGAVAVTVQPGESLWTIAQERVPDQDPRVTISQIRELNDLTGSRVLPGDQIFVPTAS